MRIVTVETTDHSYQGRLIEETPTQVKVRYLDENRERIEAWYNKDICEIECGAPRSRGDDSLKSQRAFYQELMDDGYVLVDYKLNLDPGKHWEDENGNVADYLCQFEKDGVKFYLPNDEDWFDVIAVDHKHKLALNTGFCEYDDIKADHGEYRWVYDGTKLVMGASNLKPQPPALAEAKINSQYPVRWLRLDNGDHQITYGEQVRTFPKDQDLEASETFGHCVRHAIECEGGFLD